MRLDVIKAIPDQKLARELPALIRQACKGDEAALAAVSEAFARHPVLWEEAGDTMAQVERDVITRVANGDRLMARAILRDATARRAELAGSGETDPLEGLLIQRIIICWIAVAEAEQFLHAKVRVGVTLTDLAHLEQAVDRAQRRLLSAIKTLAVVRRLARPSVQLNLAERQINLGVTH